MSQGSIPEWEKDGFDAPPAEATSTGVNFIYRCFSSTPRRDLVIRGRAVEKVGSHLYGNCFFVPRINSTISIENASSCDYKRLWTWVYLEKQLNAWFWGNDFERVAMFRFHEDVRYRIGTVGQGTRAVTESVQGKARSKSVQVQRHLPWPGVEPELLQVKLFDGSQAALMRSLTLVADWPVPGAPVSVAEA
jgi:hypothetical protein